MTPAEEETCPVEVTSGKMGLVVSVVGKGVVIGAVLAGGKVVVVLLQRENSTKR